METTELTDDQIEAMKKALQAAADAIRELWECILEAVREAAKALSDFITSIYDAYKRTRIFYKLRSYHIPYSVAWWIAKMIPRRLLLMC